MATDEVKLTARVERSKHEMLKVKLITMRKSLDKWVNEKIDEELSEKPQTVNK